MSLVEKGQRWPLDDRDFECISYTGNHQLTVPWEIIFPNWLRAQAAIPGGHPWDREIERVWFVNKVEISIDSNDFQYSAAAALPVPCVLVNPRSLATQTGAAIFCNESYTDPASTTRYRGQGIRCSYKYMPQVVLVGSAVGWSAVPPECTLSLNIIYIPHDKRTHYYGFF